MIWEELHWADDHMSIRHICTVYMYRVSSSNAGASQRSKGDLQEYQALSSMSMGPKGTSCSTDAMRLVTIAKVSYHPKRWTN